MKYYVLAFFHQRDWYFYCALPLAARSARLWTAALAAAGQLAFAFAFCSRSAATDARVGASCNRRRALSPGWSRSGLVGLLASEGGSVTAAI